MNLLIQTLVNLIVWPIHFFLQLTFTLLAALIGLLAIPFQIFGTVVGVVFGFLMAGLQLIVLLFAVGIIAAIVIGAILAFNGKSPRHYVRSWDQDHHELIDEHDRLAQLYSLADVREGGDVDYTFEKGPVIVRVSEKNNSSNVHAGEHASRRAQVVLESIVRAAHAMAVNGEVGHDDEACVDCVEEEVDSEQPALVAMTHGSGDESAAGEKDKADDRDSLDVPQPPTTPTAATVSTERPAWVDEAEDFLHDGTHRVRAESGPCETAAECRRDLPLRVREAAHKYVLGQVQAWMGSSPFSDWVAKQWTAEALRRHRIAPTAVYADTHEVKLEEVTSKSHFLYGLLEFDGEFRDQLRRDMQSYVRSARLGSYWCSTILGVAGLAVWFRGSSVPKSVEAAPQRFMARGGASVIWVAAGVLSLASAAWIPWL